MNRFQRVEIRIRTDDIRKNEEKFRRLLQENVISDFNTFRTSLENIEQTIITRIGLINLHLAKVWISTGAKALRLISASFIEKTTRIKSSATFARNSTGR